MKKKIVFVILFFCVSGGVFSQINEIGIFAGGSNYIGDIGRTNYIYPNSFAVGGIYKWNMHPHYSIRATYIYSKLSGDDSESNNSFRKYRDLSFTNDIHELAVGIEYHFFKYSLSKTGYTNTPYVFIEAGTVNYGISEELGGGRTFNFTMPFGAGFKTILAPSIGIGFELGFRYTFKDDIDSYPYDLESPNVQINPNNNDWYVFTGITLVFGFGREGCYTGSF
ncbi:DUF6089 family protein [Lutimonas saemankumensis]|uniref:type IX secretion system protein PorG n=1 Tax=Lutimonas saemankumensis TaxID=483016 RepID=UPI001CD78532|nr:DUF6089 family protein [Lutimonas saemankumensis]MCA0933526.1 DUF6089 family protein [Lutimonas saemankumensis]